MSKLKFAFFGTPEVAKQTLYILRDYGHMPEVIITSPDARAGRGMKMQASPAAMFAEENNIPCLKPDKLDKDFISALSQFNVELHVVVAYGKMIPEEILNLPKLGSFNIHYSLLPKYRGASPVESAILHGDTETGVTIQHMIYKMDAGPIVAMEKTSILPDETAPELRERLIKIGGALLASFLFKISDEEVEETPQDEKKATLARKIEKKDGLVYPLKDDPVIMYNKFRAYADWPRTYFFKDGKRFIITAAKFEGGKFVIEKVIPEGKKEQEYRG